MRRGFTLIEVVVALLILEIAVLGTAGQLLLASRTLRDAERLERATALAEGALDSLAGSPTRVDGLASFHGGVVGWEIGLAGELSLVAVDEHGDTLFELRSVLP